MVSSEAHAGPTEGRILLVDDEPSVLHALRRTLRRGGMEVAVAGSAAEALEALARESFAAVVTDQRMPAMDGVTVLERARQLCPDTVRVMLTGLVEMETALEAINRGEVSRFLTKPWRDDELRQVLSDAVKQYHITAENRHLQEVTRRQNEALREANAELERARQQEIEIGAAIQQSLLAGRHAPRQKGFDLASLAIPSQAVDGDFCDFFDYGDEVLDIAVGDVMGKGVPAALLGAAVKSHLLRAFITLLASGGGALPRPEQVVGRLHQEMTPQLLGLESFVTLWYGRLDLASRTLTYVGCGHPRPLLQSRPTGQAQWLDSFSLPLGISTDEAYHEASVPLPSGSRLLVYSDGVTEARPPKSGRLFGSDRLLEVVEAGRTLDVRQLLAALRVGVADYVGSERPADDLTCVAVDVDVDGGEGGA